MKDQGKKLIRSPYVYFSKYFILHYFETSSLYQLLFTSMSSRFFRRYFMELQWYSAQLFDLIRSKALKERKFKQESTRNRNVELHSNI